ncbi:MAG: hypothetical protein R3344_02365 [Acidobacteriota bacterium]|nr:hypothetical protein [Acidobacteriota bacterium]
MRSGVRIGSIALVCALAAGPSLAGSIEITLRERNGGPIGEQWIAVESSTADIVQRARRARTDFDGTARFDGLSAGTYKVTVGSLHARDLVPPSENPFAPPPVVTLPTGNEDLRITLELWRGVRVVSQIVLDRRDSPRSAVYYESLESDLRLESRFDLAGYAERVLVPGRWRVSIDPPPGFLLTDFEVDGRSRDGSHAVLDLERYPATTFLTWRYSGPALVYGRVTREGKGRMTVAATLLEPGRWIEQVEERGGSDIRHVNARWIDPDNYEIVLPDGRWSVRPSGAGVVWSDPEEEIVVLAPGEERRVDFTVRLESGDSSELLVNVTAAEGRWAPIEEARVEVWSLDDSGSPLAKVGEGETKSWPRPARIYGLPAGKYLVVAGHPDYLEGRQPIDYEPDPEDPRTVDIRLPAGAAVLATALDEDDTPVPEVDVRVIRLDDPPDIVLEDQRFRDAKKLREGPTDTTGHIKLTGLYPGRYAVMGRLRGALAATRFVRVMDDGKQKDEIEITLGGEEERRVELAVRPAASVSGSLACTDGGSLPGATSIRALPPGNDDIDRREDPDLTENALLTVDDLALTGKHGDRFLAGPFEERPIQLALRPSGYAIWTWALSTEQREYAAVLTTSLGDTDDLGTIQIECGPAAEAIPVVGNESPLPDLRDVEVRATATALRDNPQRRSVRPRIEQHADSVLLRDLPEGKIEIELVLSHPHFLPTDEQRWVFESEIDRGRLVIVEPDIPAIGGAIVVPGTDGNTARLGGAGDFVRETDVEDNRARFVSVPAGTYRVELCADADCAEVRRVWEKIVVEVGETLTLD